MKKILAVLYICLFLAVQGRSFYSRNQTGTPEVEAANQDYYLWRSDWEWETLPIIHSAVEPGGGANPYITHPEFTTVMTTTVTTPAQGTAEGYIFVGALAQFSSGPATLLILDDLGEPVYIQVVPGNPFSGDFKVQTVNGTDYLTYHLGSAPGGYTLGSSYVLNTNYELVDTWTIDNGNGSDTHDFILLDNGHAIVMGYWLIPYDLSPYGGPVNGTLVDIILQEQDENKNVVFEWRGSEHIPIGDTEVEINTTNPVDFMHTNALAVDTDGNWLLSNRNLSEITKISRQTGEIIWRMGGAANEFTFTNDIGFSKQHNINRLENGHISLFDNGNDHEPPHSRAIEYAVDETAKTVTRVWSYPDDTSEYSAVMSNMQRLDNGNSFIGWGNVPKLTEVWPNGTIGLEMLLGAGSYRAFRFPWNGLPLTTPRAVLQYGADPTAVTIYTSWNGATHISSYDVYAGPTRQSLVLVDNAARSGFETEINLSSLPVDTCFFQTKPVHEESEPTLVSNLMYRLDLQVCWDQLDHSFLPVMAK